MMYNARDKSIDNEHRLSACRIVRLYCTDHTMKEAGIHFGILEKYIEFAANLHTRKNGSMICPAWAISEILKRERRI